jgi:hypothetical protein
MSAYSLNFRFRHSHGGTGCGSAHKPIPPAPAVFDQGVTDMGAIQQAHIGQDAPVPMVRRSKYRIRFSSKPV